MVLIIQEYEDIHKIFIQSDGIVRTSEIQKQGFHNRRLSELMQQGKVVKLKNGYYQWIEDSDYEEAAIITRLFPDAIMYLDSALYFHGYTDRTPTKWHIAVDKDTGKSRFKISYPPVQVYFIEGKYLPIGATIGKMQDVDIKVYDKERTICDVLRYVNKMDREVVNKAIHAYIKDPGKNISLLMEYEKKLRVLNKVKIWIGVWL